MTSMKPGLLLGLVVAIWVTLMAKSWQWDNQREGTRHLPWLFLGWVVIVVATRAFLNEIVAALKVQGLYLGPTSRSKKDDDVRERNDCTDLELGNAAQCAEVLELLHVDVEDEAADAPPTTAANASGDTDSQTQSQPDCASLEQLARAEAQLPSSLIHLHSQEFELSIDEFLTEFVCDGAAFSLKDSHEARGDTAVSMEAWSADGAAGGEPGATSRRLTFTMKISAPMAPPIATGVKTQTLELFGDGGGAGCIWCSSTRMEAAVPYATSFTVEDVWLLKPVLGSGAAGGGGPRCRLTMLFEARFTQSTWLKGTIASKSKSENTATTALWIRLALERQRVR
jgi:hypothetical protein